MEEIEAATKVSLASPSSNPSSMMTFATPKKAAEAKEDEDEVTPTKVLDVARDH